MTGSFAAVGLAPVFAPSVLVLYCRVPSQVAGASDLLPAERGGAVALVRPADEVVFAGATVEEGIRLAAPSQVAADCLAGHGHMPAEGEAVLRWMAGNEPRWRLGSLAELGGP